MVRRYLPPAALLIPLLLLGSETAFHAQTSGSGISLVLAERFGGQGVHAMAPDGAGNMWIVGDASFNAIPVTADAAQPTMRGSSDAYLIKLRPDGSVAYGSYLGGSSWEDGFGVATDPAGNVYVVGRTASADFPVTAGAFSTTSHGDDGFLTKFSSDGRSILYSTYIPGTFIQSAAVAADASGRAYVTGMTLSTNFPTTETIAPNGNVFYMRFGVGGALEYSTLIGGSGGEQPNGIAVDGAGNAYVVGYTNSPDFTMRRALKSTFPSTAGEQGFLARFTSTGLDYSTYIGGSGSDYLYAVAVTTTGVYVAGATCSWDFPGTSNPRSTSGGCDEAAVIAKLQLDGSAYLASTLLNGSSADLVMGIAAGSDERVYAFGTTQSLDFPATQDAQQITSGGASDAFFARLSMPDATHFHPDYVTYFGGGQGDSGAAIVADGAGGAWGGGWTNNADWPTLSSSQNSSQSVVTHYAVTGATAPASDDIVLYAKDASPIVGNWQVVADSTAAGGARIWNPDAGAPKITTPAASPANYFDMTFNAQAGVPYHLWMRMRADNDSWSNDSVWVQFSDSVDSTGSPTWQIGSTTGTMVSLERCTDCGEQGWGWADNGYNTEGVYVRFATTGTHTIRVQQREDGVSIDQIVLSSRTWITNAPGAAKNDTTIVPQGSTPPPPPPPPPPSNQPPTVAITSPANGTTVDQSSWPVIDASASDPDGTIAKVDFYANSTLLWTDTAAPYRVSWESMPEGTYSLTAVATDNNGAATTSSPVTLVVAARSSGRLPWYWTDQDVGNVGAAGTATYSNGTFTVQGAGADVWGTADALHFADVSLGGTDAAIVARVASVSAEASWVKAGVMMRTSPDPSSAQAFMLVSHAKGVCFQRRVSAGGTSTSTCGTLSTAPRWVKLARVGTVISGYESADGISWTLVGSDTFPDLTGGFAGLAVSSHVTGTLATATFDHVWVMDNEGPNQPPTVSVTSPANGATFTAPATISIGINALDDTGVARIDLYANSTLIGTVTGNSNTSDYTFTWSNVPAGTYTLTPIAFDGQGASTTSAPVSITVSGSAPPPGGQCSSLTLSQTFFYSGGPASNWQITVTAPSDTCTWTASIDQSWLVLNGVTGPTTIAGTGSGKVSLQTLDNRTGANRYGTFTIGGVAYKVTQEPF